MMRYRQFGNTDLKLSEICFGAMRFTSTASHVTLTESRDREQEETQNREGRRALEAALAGGVNCIHSSGDYGTRWMLSDILARHPKRKEIHHVIKMTSPDYEEGEFDPKVLRQSVEDSLRDLHADRIAIVQHLQRGPHVPKAEAYAEAGDRRRIDALPDMLGPLRETFEALRHEGKVGHLITFPHTIGYATAALDTGAYDGVAHFFNLIEPEALPLLDRLKREGKGFLAIRPLLQGMLTDKRIDRRGLPETDLKLRSGWDSRYALLHKIRECIGEPNESWTRFALKFALAHEAVTSLVASGNSVTQVEALLEACDGQYPSRELLDDVYARVEEVGMPPKADLFGL
ncbi:aldo/keto reductase [Halomonas sp. MA07-2]|uniref:aldo/keto reductase n=1 Tax=Halomonas sp. MA07-2 TaxID=3440841 RepID=UPI003EEFA5D8